MHNPAIASTMSVPMQPHRGILAGPGACNMLCTTSHRARPKPITRHANHHRERSAGHDPPWGTTGRAGAQRTLYTMRCLCTEDLPSKSSLTTSMLTCWWSPYLSETFTDCASRASEILASICSMMRSPISRCSLVTGVVGLSSKAARAETLALLCDVCKRTHAACGLANRSVRPACSRVQAGEAVHAKDIVRGLCVVQRRRWRGQVLGRIQIMRPPAQGHCTYASARAARMPAVKASHDAAKAASVVHLTALEQQARVSRPEFVLEM